jgi:hypothetical protein
MCANIGHFMSFVTKCVHSCIVMMSIMSRAFWRFVTSGLLLFAAGAVIIPFAVQATTPKWAAPKSYVPKPVVTAVEEAKPVEAVKPPVKVEPMPAPAPKPVVAKKPAPKPVVAVKPAPKPVVVKQAVAQVTVSATKSTSTKSTAAPSSLCLTAAMKALNDAAVVQMQKDIAKYGAGHDAAVATYKAHVADAWATMSEPYCGFGTLGVSAVRKSFQKTIDRARAAFLAATR